mgnify:FL=1
MNTYLIKIDGLYFAGITEHEMGKSAVGGWYDEGKTIRGLLLVPEKERAKKIEGNVNLNSYWKRIYDLLRYGNLQFKKLEIEKVDAE